MASASVDVQKIERITPTRLVHASQCRDAACGLPVCHKMKRVVQHMKKCEKKTYNGGCPVCKQLMPVCCYHAKRCGQQSCPVPFCLKIKHTLRQLELMLGRQQFLRRQD